MTREEGVHLLKPFLENLKEVVAVWEGGSQATNRIDDHSDLDLLIITTDDAVEKTLQETQEYLKKQVPLRHYIRAPEPTWHGFSQFFYIPEHASLFYFDLSFTKVSQPDKFTDVERHGTAHLWFEKRPIYHPTHWGDEKRNALHKRVFQTAVLYEPIFKIETLKACQRNLILDAKSMYFTYLMRALVPLINLQYRPNKADFGIRYLHVDLPQTTYQELVDLFAANLPDEISEKLQVATKWFEALKTKLNV